MAKGHKTGHVSGKRPHGHERGAYGDGHHNMGHPQPHHPKPHMGHGGGEKISQQDKE